MITEQTQEPKLIVEYHSRRRGNIFRISDLDNREIALHQKDAIKIAKRILRVALEKKGEET